MKRLLIAFAVPCLALCLACDSSDNGTPANPDVSGTDAGSTDPGGQPVADLSATIIQPAADAVITGSQQIAVQMTGPVTQMELLVDGEVAETKPLPNGGSMASMTWDPALEGACDLQVRVSDADGESATSDAVSVFVDLAVPVVAVPETPGGFGRMAVLDGSVDVPVEVVEANVASIKLFDQHDTELASATELVTTLPWDTTTSVDGVVWLKVEVTDAVGRVAVTQPLPVVVANNGEEVPVEYIPEAEVYIPTNWQSVEYHTRIMATAKANIWKVVSWLWWDDTDDWLMEYSLGQGFCPHNGIQYTLHTASGGEIIIELAREDLDQYVINKAPADFAANPDTFPVSDDPAKFGSFFGHIAPMEPADHVEQRVDIEVHHVFLYK